MAKKIENQEVEMVEVTNAVETDEKEVETVVEEPKASKVKPIVKKILKGVAIGAGALFCYTLGKKAAGKDENFVDTAFDDQDYDAIEGNGESAVS